MPTAELWRVFPWERGVAEGQRYSPEFVPHPSGRGRFDLPRNLSSALYLAETPEHAVAEVIQPWRGGRIGSAHLQRASRPLALVKVHLDTSGLQVADLCDPRVLTHREIAPDRSAYRSRTTTQPMARALWDSGYAGLRWWSSFWGDWHTWVLFASRTEGRLTFGQPSVLAVETQAVTDAARALGIELVA